MIATRYPGLMRLYILCFGLSGVLACAGSTDVTFYHPDADPELAPEPEAFLEGEPQYVLVPEDQWTRARADEPPRSVVYTEPGELPRLELAGGGALPLRSTSVRAHLRGPVAEVIVTQRFVNDRRGPLEAVYTFPLPENSAVDRMRMILGDRTIEAEVREKNQARQVYQAAADAGHTAALLEQERPNVFTQSIANIPPGQTVDVELHYLQTLSYDGGEYEFVFPTVVGPRYVPGAAIGRRGSGELPDTDRVPDASRITPPTVGRGERSGHDIAIEVVAEAGSPIHSWITPMHEVQALATGERLHLKLSDRDRIPNRDFVLRYRSAAARPVARMFVQPRGDQGGHFMLVAEPPRLDVDELIGRRELLFVVDVSGSMSGAPLALAKAAMRESLAGIRPVDTFDVFVFSGATGRLFAAPRPATRDNVRQALEFVDGLTAAGGTEMAGAVDGALASPVPADRHRYVFFLTDGNTGEEAEIARRARLLVERQRQLGRRARVFGVGIGSSPNTHLIAELSQAGAGVPLAIHTPADISRAVRTFERLIDAPVLTDLAVDWGGIRVDAVYPESRDLFASRPLVLHGRYTGAAPVRPKLALRGSLGARVVTVPVEVDLAGERTDVLASLWARARVDELDLRRITAPDSAVADAIAGDILATGLDYHLVTAYTSLVAVDSARVVHGPRSNVVQPVEVPQDISPEHALGRRSRGVQVNMQSALRSDAARVTRVRMDEMSGVPVGGTSRDFTAVVDLAPTAGRDHAGIRLAATSGPFVSPDHTPEGALRSGLRRDGVPASPAGSGSRGPSARARLARITGPTVAAADALRAALGDDLAQLTACLRDGEHARRLHLRKLRLVVRVLTGHRLHDLAFHAGEPLAAATRTCIGEHLEASLRSSAAPSGAFTLDLRVWLRP